MGCAPWRDSYFDGGVGELTQPEIRKKLGKPHKVDAPLLSDETTWMYRYTLTESDLDPWGIKTFGKEAGNLFGPADASLREKVYCYVYALTFDQKGVLRHWERDRCQIPKQPDPFPNGLS